jgi:hypothetical protein
MRLGADFTHQMWMCQSFDMRDQSVDQATDAFYGNRSNDTANARNKPYAVVLYDN